MRGKELPPSSPFAGDDGSTPPALGAALARAHDEERSPAALAAVVEALADARVLVPVLAQLDVEGRTVDGFTIDKEASAGIVALEGPDGRTVLPVFSSTAAMALWDPAARPVPSTAVRAALSAVQEGWELLVVDPGGPVTVVIPRTATWALARQEAWRPAVVEVDGAAQVDPAVQSSVRFSLAGIAEVRSVDAVPGERAEVALRLAIDAGLDRAGLDAVLARVNAALARDAVVAARVDSLELRVRAQA